VLVLLPPQSGLDDILRRNFSLIDLFGCASSIARAADSASPGKTRYPTADLFPILGAPHPLSPGERKLAERLLADPELAPLFAFNRRIAGRHGNDYIVDLVWQEGGLVVEVDSFQAHGSRFAFAQDRHRDYELMAANYRVLRITHDEAARDTDSAVEKIRMLVRLIRRSYKQE
ncbi:MAG: endonuclease domain-containing protein, partial [Blastocatellia bacterium]